MYEDWAKSSTANGNPTKEIVIWRRKLAIWSGFSVEVGSKVMLAGIGSGFWGHFSLIAAIIVA